MEWIILIHHCIQTHQVKIQMIVNQYYINKVLGSTIQ
jgi:hypothetical protein